MRNFTVGATLRGRPRQQIARNPLPHPPVGAISDRPQQKIARQAHRKNASNYIPTIVIAP